MANLSKEKITELQKIIREDYGKEITHAEAEEIGRGMVGSFALLAKIQHRILKDKSSEVESGVHSSQKPR